MTWANVDDLFPEHPKVLAAGGDAAWLYICGLCFTNRNLTEGKIPKAVVPRISDRKGPMRLAQKLVDVGLWHDQGDHFTIHDWEKYNENAEEVKARKEHARKAAQTRWSGRKNPPATDAPSTAQSMPGAMPGASDEHASGICTKPDRAMPSHSSPTPPSGYRSSSSLDGVGEPAGESEEEEIREHRTQAVKLIAERQLQVRMAKTNLDPVSDRAGWLKSARAKVWTDHAGELEQMSGEGLTPKAMADRIMPALTSPYPTDGVNQSAWTDDDVTIDEHGRLVVARRAG